MMDRQSPLGSRQMAKQGVAGQAAPAWQVLGNRFFGAADVQELAFIERTRCCLIKSNRPEPQSMSPPSRLASGGDSSNGDEVDKEDPINS